LKAPVANNDTLFNEVVSDFKATKSVLWCVVFSGSSGRYDSYEGGGRAEYKSKSMAGG